MSLVEGDTHAYQDIWKLDEYVFTKGQELTKNDYVIILGDFGFIWNKDQETIKDNAYLDWLNGSPWTTLVVLGNHDNWNAVRTRFPQIDFNGAKAYQIRESVIVIERGEIFNIDDNVYFAFGGGFSIDFYKRKKDVDWWVEEIPTVAEVKHAFDNLEKVNFTVDYVLTHDLPKKQLGEFGFSQKLVPMWVYEEEDKENDRCDIQIVLQDFKNYGLKFKHWYSGHFHIDETRDKHTILYNDIIAVGETL